MKLTGCSFAGTSNYGTRFSQQVEGAGDTTPIQITKLTDASSTGLFRDALVGSFNSNAVITFLRTGTHEPREYMRVELFSCGIVDFSIDSGGDDRSVERFGIRYGAMNVISWGYDAQGTPAGRASANIKSMA
jgi:type VI protein secretion system component Hcp